MQHPPNEQAPERPVAGEHQAPINHDKRRRVILLSGGAAGLLLLVLIIAAGLNLSAYKTIDLAELTTLDPAESAASPVPGTSVDRTPEALELDKQLKKLLPRGAYVVIDRTNNWLWVRKGDEILLEAVISAGSGQVLDDPAGNRTWTFDTPTGAQKIRGLLRSPVWRRPDWAFIEEGLPVPKSDSERFEYGVLGEYALDLGDGYLIHGTLYERLLGRSVTHGCIRVGRDDLRTLVSLVSIGTPVYIF